ncbi:histidine phosphatase family protein [Nocardia sp. SYP-A9097]|uniref:histidine phosphatase family protein n=1 Tax=Nocardia sp. SYP-A9097 TaxID=2663237 RepID=UPI00129A401A|nr:histidine phosphatase family protein [Nocardia sp. SYP-A9097]MRH89024.1 histidine phosphatase family protein [Nocardia sp. SYP-A9097]
MALESLTMVRHGESAGNAAAARAALAESEVFDSGTRDPDSPLTELGRRQAGAVGAWLAGRPERRWTVWCSPYLRARETADIALRGTTVSASRVDERLRDRDIGSLHGLTELGWRRRYPEELARRERLGRFYYRPPGGESWTDVALRLRTLLPELDGHVLVFAHDIVVVMMRYVLDNLDENAILAIEKNQIRNASISRWERSGSRLVRAGYNETAHLG